MKDLKAQVKDHWENDVCGSRYGDFQTISRLRYESHAGLWEFADFSSAKDKKVLEIGLGTGADFENWVKHGADATGVDLTEASIETVTKRLLESNYDNYQLKQGDAEALPFEDGSFDIVYSFGVLHHTPNTEKAISEAVRVLKPGGILKMMVYHVTSWSAWIMWLLALAKGELTTPRKAIYKYLESPGTKAYTVREARKILEALPLADIAIEPRLAQSDLMDIMPSERHDNRAFYIAKSLYPRPIVRLLGDRFGLNLFIEARRTAG